MFNEDRPGPGRTKVRLLSSLAIGAAALGFAQPGHALNLYTGDGVEVNLSTTVQYSGAARVNNPSTQVLSEISTNDGDENLKHGIVSNEFEVLPVLSVSDGSFGVHISGEAYLNTVYLQRNQNSSPSTLNYFTSDNQKFSRPTQNLDGRNDELLDAFAYDSFNFGADDSQTVTFKVGRQTLLWGQSLFFTNNGIAAGQAPVDVNLAATLANPQAQQIFMPVGQAVLTYQPNNYITLQGYYQFEWRSDLLPGAGSYFSPVDFLVPGGTKFIVGEAPFGPVYFSRAADIKPPSENGQFGVSAQFQLGTYDLGLYALRFDDKGPQFYLNPFPPGPPHISPAGLAAGNYQVVYAKDIEIYGASLSTNVGPVNVAGELSTRVHQDLFSNPVVLTPGLNTNDNPGYAVGNTLNGQVSGIYLTPGLPLMPGGMTMLGEVEANRVMTVSKNKSDLVPGRTANALGFQFLVAPNYYSVVPHLDVTFPIGFTWFPTGRSEFTSTMQAGTGQLNLGVSATYYSVWKAGLTYSDYLGSTSNILPGNPKQIYADRGYVSLYVSRTF